MHVVILDNGRSAMLADPVMREALYCLRCGACLNVCPVYRRIGGHAYNSPYPGPIGSIVSPNLFGSAAAKLPFASTLCGACRDICPVKIDIPRILLHLRWKANVAEPPTTWPAAARRPHRSEALRANGALSAHLSPTQPPRRLDAAAVDARRLSAPDARAVQELDAVWARLSGARRAPESRGQTVSNAGATQRPK
jgi:L-lactate dehydrogenase complex protein LldF